MQELQIGDKVVHFVHGPGTVRALSSLTFVNRHPDTYFVIAFSLLRTELYVPANGPNQPPRRRPRFHV